MDDLRGKLSFSELVEFQIESLEKFKETYGVSFLEVCELSFVDFLIEIHPGVETILTKGGGVYHVVDEGWANQISGAAQILPEALEVALEICARNTYEGRPLPYGLRTTASMLIRGTFNGKKRRGPPLRPDFGKRWILFENAVFLSQFYQVELTRNEASAENSACDVMVEVARRFGLEVTYTALRDWCTKAKHADFRARAEIISNYYKDLALCNSGALNRPTEFGPFIELGRMRTQM